MKNVVFYICIVFLFSACAQAQRQVELKDLVFRCTVADVDPSDRMVRVVINGKEQCFSLDQNGYVEIKVPQIAPQYSSVTYKRKFYPCYLIGGEPVEMKVFADPDNWKREFKGGGKAINEYLSSGIETFETGLFREGEKELLSLTNDLVKRNMEKMQKRSLPEDFMEMEKERLRYDAYGRWYMYRTSHRWMAKAEGFEPGDLYYETMENLAKENVVLYTIPEYRSFIRGGVEVMAQKGAEEKTSGQIIREELKYIDEHYKDTLIRSDLAHHFVYDYIKSSGVKGEEDVISFYRQNVKDKALLADFDKICFTWEHLQPGMESPVFNYVNAKGDTVTLESFRGKYVVIDLWASWCGPCRREIPYLQKLEKALDGKNIVFVSISCDNDEEAWRQGMNEEKLTGIQLFANKDKSFFEAYMVNSIPRFILLDKEGKIVNANMTAPSKPETEEYLRALPGLV